MESCELIVISNRLPVTLNKLECGKWEYKESSGGLVAGLSGLKAHIKFTWIGWPGFEIETSEQENVIKELERFACVPVFLPTNIAEPYYSGFSNGVLWPLFHYLPTEVEFREDQWDAYIKANELFCEATINYMRKLSSKVIVWIHDYHLMLLPEILKNTLGNKIDLKLGFFLHTPFPTSEIYRYIIFDI